MPRFNFDSPVNPDAYDLWRGLLEVGHAARFPGFLPSIWSNPLNVVRGSLRQAAALEWLPRYAAGAAYATGFPMPSDRACLEAFEVATLAHGPAISRQFAARLAAIGADLDRLDADSDKRVAAEMRTRLRSLIGDFVAQRGVDDPSEPTAGSGDPARAVSVRYLVKVREPVGRKGASRLVTTELRTTEVLLASASKSCCRWPVFSAPLDVAGERAPIRVVAVDGRPMRPVLAPDTLRPCTLDSFEWAAQGRFAWRDDPFRPVADRELPCPRPADFVRAAEPPARRSRKRFDDAAERLADLQRVASTLCLVGGLVYRPAGFLLRVEVDTARGGEARFACETTVPGDEAADHDGAPRRPLCLRMDVGF